MTSLRAMTKHVSESSPKFVPAYAAYELLTKAVDIGADPATILERAQIACSIEDLQSRVEPFPRRQFAALYRECILALEAHAHRRSGRLAMEVNETFMLFYCIISCRTLGDAIRRTGEFFAMLDRGIHASLQIAGGVAEFAMKSRREIKNTASFLSDLVGLSSFHQFYGWMIGSPIELYDVEMCYDPVFEKDIFMDPFGIPVKLGGAVHCFRFDADLLDRPTIRSYPELEALLEMFPFDVMPPEYKTARIAHHVRNILNNAILARARIPRIPDLAKTFNLSSATLRRRLVEEGTSINEIREACRRDLAREYLANRGLTLQQIAERLGFSDGSTFRRAFKSWYGASPTDYRRHQMRPRMASACSASGHEQRPPATK
ncbi:MAG TPA: helix-turn-helix domain-containing protein [Alphaproteobacteria bacterium]|nr:helix-turn-helix domain-containing protein [Alphaproteobacteria bacterium]